MRAIRTHRMRLIVHPRQQHLPALNAIHLYLSLLPILKVELRDVLELVFLRHDSGSGAKSGAVGISKDGAVEEVKPGDGTDTGGNNGGQREHETERQGEGKGGEMEARFGIVCKLLQAWLVMRSINIMAANQRSFHGPAVAPPCGLFRSPFSLVAPSVCPYLQK